MNSIQKMFIGAVLLICAGARADVDSSDMISPPEVASKPVPEVAAKPAPPVVQAPGIHLQATSGMHTARVTFYDPSVNNRMEGGGRDRYMEPINSVEDAISNGRPVSIAADVYGTFGKTCNRPADRCTVLIYAPGFDHLYPSYRRHFPHLPANSFIGIVEDTGGDFFGTSGGRFDIAVRSRTLANAAPDFFSGHVKWARLNSPCGSGASSRHCNLSSAAIAPTTLAMLNIPTT